MSYVSWWPTQNGHSLYTLTHTHCMCACIDPCSRLPTYSSHARLTYNKISACTHSHTKKAKRAEGLLGSRRRAHRCCRRAAHLQWMHGMTRNGMHCISCHGMIWHGTTWHSMACTVIDGMAWHTRHHITLHSMAHSQHTAEHRQRMARHVVAWHADASLQQAVAWRDNMECHALQYWINACWGCSEKVPQIGNDFSVICRLSNMKI